MLRTLPLLLPLPPLCTSLGISYRICGARTYFRASTLQCNFAFNTFFSALPCLAWCCCMQRLLAASPPADCKQQPAAWANNCQQSSAQRTGQSCRVAASQQQQQQQQQPSENHSAFPRLVTEALAPKSARIYRISITRQSSANPRAVVAVPCPPLSACLTTQLSHCPTVPMSIVRSLPGAIYVRPRSEPTAKTLRLAQTRPPIFQQQQTTKSSSNCNCNSNSECNSECNSNSECSLQFIKVAAQSS